MNILEETKENFGTYTSFVEIENPDGGRFCLYFIREKKNFFVSDENSKIISWPEEVQEYVKQNFEFRNPNDTDKNVIKAFFPVDGEIVKKEVAIIPKWIN